MTNDNATVENLLRDLVIANRALAVEGVIDDFGHVSARHPSRPDRFFRRGRARRVSSREMTCWSLRSKAISFVPTRADCMPSVSYMAQYISSVRTLIA